MNRVVLESDWRPLLNLKPNASMPPCNNALALIPVTKPTSIFFVATLNNILAVPNQDAINSFIVFEVN